MNIVTQLIKFLDPWKYIMKEIQLSNSPSLFITLPCIPYLKQQIKKIERTMRGSEFLCINYIIYSYNKFSHLIFRYEFFC
jgi:hypothetical protein